MSNEKTNNNTHSSAFAFSRSVPHIRTDTKKGKPDYGLNKEVDDKEEIGAEGHQKPQKHKASHLFEKKGSNIFQCFNTRTAEQTFADTT